MEINPRIGTWWLLAVFAVTFVVYAASPVRQNYDSYLAFPTAQSLVHERNLTLDEFSSPTLETNGVMSSTDGGHRINYFPWVPSLALVPPVLALDIGHAFGVGPGSYAVANGGHMDLIQQLSASLLMAVVVAIVFAISFRRLRGSLTIRRRRIVAGLVTFGFAFGSAAWSTASRALWQHGPSLLFLSIAVYCCQELVQEADIRSERHAQRLAVALGAAVAASFTCRPTNAVAVLGFTAFVAFSLRRRLAPFLVGAIAVVIPWTVVNLMVFGSLLAPYFTASRLGPHPHYAEALALNLVSPARGLLLFSPIVLLGVAGVFRRVRGSAMDDLLRFDRLLAVMALGYLLASSGLSENWWAGHSFGPRFMSDTLVFFAACATPTVAALLDRHGSLGPRVRRRFATVSVALLVWSVLVNAQGGVMRSTLCWNGSPDIDTHHSRLWDFHSPQLLSGIQAAADSGVVRAIFTRCDGPASNGHV